MEKINVAEIMTIIGEISKESETYKVLAKEVIKTVQNFGPEIDSVLEPIRKYLVNSTCKDIEQFEHCGFTREEAIVLTIDNKIGLRNALDSYRSTSNKGGK